MAEEEGPSKCTLYVFPFSLYSIMARFTAALGASTGLSTKPIIVEPKLVDVHRDENIAEWYLLTLNRKGQIPTMVVEGEPAPVPDSLNISYWFCSVYPRLLPQTQEAKIKNYLSQLHSIEAISLSAARPEQPQEDNLPTACDEMLANTGISDEYRLALEHKKEVDRGHLVTALHHENIERAENQARALFESITEVYLSCRDESPWLFGGNIGPTILDAHIVPFIARVGEGGRAKLIPNDLRQYARRIVALPQWLEVTHGRRTMWDVSYGHVRLIKDI